MICKMCGSNNGNGAKFCNYCGTALEDMVNQNQGINLSKGPDNQQGFSKEGYENDQTQRNENFYNLNHEENNYNQGFNQNLNQENNPNHYSSNGPNHNPNSRPGSYPYFAQNSNFGQYPNQGQQINIIKSYMTPSIIALVVAVIFSCCMFSLSIISIGLGIAAVVFAYQTDQLLKRGMYEEARKKSKLTKIFFLSCFATTFFISILGTILRVLAILSAISAFGSSFQEIIKPENAQELQKFMEEFTKGIKK